MPSDARILSVSEQVLIAEALTRSIANIGAIDPLLRPSVLMALRVALAAMAEADRNAFCDGMALLEQAEYNP